MSARPHVRLGILLGKITNEMNALSEIVAPSNCPRSPHLKSTGLALLWLRRLSLLILIGLSSTLSSKANNPDCFTRNYSWTFLGREHRMSLDISWDSYDFYENVPRVYNEYGVYSFEHPEHAIVTELTEQFRYISRKNCLSEWGTIEMIVAFIQQLRYQPEKGEYPKFPLETLADRGGDCEDLSVLLVAILREMGYATQLVNPPGHMAVALACANCDGIHFRQDGRKYFYIETTSPRYQIGEAPPEFKGKMGRMFATDNSGLALAYLDRVSKASAPVPAMYYLREDDHRYPVKLGTETWVAAAKVQSMQVHGDKSTGSVLTGIGENDSASLPPLAWAEENKGKVLLR